jgi:hypothetical protein
MVAVALGCEREPAIVVRFDPADLAGRDLSRARDLGATDAATGAASGAPRDAGASAAAKKLAPAMACATDADCVLVTDGCCDCANGGKQRAVPKRAPRPAADPACKEVMCTMMMSTDPSCGKRAACLEHACAMREARPDELPRHLPLKQRR